MQINIINDINRSTQIIPGNRAHCHIHLLHTQTYAQTAIISTSALITKHTAAHQEGCRPALIISSTRVKRSTALISHMTPSPL